MFGENEERQKTIFLDHIKIGKMNNKDLKNKN